MTIARYFRKLSDFPYPLRFPLQQKILSRMRGFSREHYLVCVRQAALEARALGFERLSTYEFGVAAGKGLLELEAIASHVEAQTNVKFDVYGFDSGVGLPMAEDYRDTPYKWGSSWYKMDVEGLKRKLKRANLVIGDVAKTVPNFIANDLKSPIGAIMFDLDYYSSTKATFAIFTDTPVELRLPRIFCYFDDIGGIEDVGVLLAISEFNAAHKNMKIRPRPYWQFHRNPYMFGWKLFEFHQFDHPLYNKLVRGETTL